jgi:hypothetical protein
LAIAHFGNIGPVPFRPRRLVLAPLGEVYRAIKRGGTMCTADLVAADDFPDDAVSHDVRGEWLNAAQSTSDYLRAVADAGFQEVTVQEETVFPLAEKVERLEARIAGLRVTARK